MRVRKGIRGIAAIVLALTLSGCGDEEGAADDTTETASEDARADAQPGTEDDIESNDSGEQPEAVAAGECGDQRTRACPVGTTLEFGDWTVTVDSFNLDAADIVAATTGRNNEPAPDGFKYIIANFTFTNHGSEARAPGRVSFSYVDAAHSSDMTSIPSTNARLDSQLGDPPESPEYTVIEPGVTVTAEKLLVIPVDPPDHAAYAVFFGWDDNYPIWVAFQ